MNETIEEAATGAPFECNSDTVAALSFVANEKREKKLQQLKAKLRLTIDTTVDASHQSTDSMLTPLSDLSDLSPISDDTTLVGMQSEGVLSSRGVTPSEVDFGEVQVFCHSKITVLSLNQGTSVLAVSYRKQRMCPRGSWTICSS